MPPQELFHPVLPTKINNKLLFALCYSYAEENNETECHHTKGQKCFTGTCVLGKIFNMLCNPAIEISPVLEVNQDTLIVNHEYKDESYDVFPHSQRMLS